MQINRARYLALERLHALRKCVAQALDNLEQREIGVSCPAAGEIGAAIVLQQPLEIPQIFRHAFLPEFLGAFFCRLTLVLIIQRHADRMMGIVNLHDKIRDSKLQLMHP